MKTKTIYLLGLVMVLLGALSTLQFTLRLQDLFQIYLTRYSHLFGKGLVGRCLYLDMMMFLYIASLLFKNLYYVIGGSLLLIPLFRSFIEFGRELGLLASVIALVTEISSRLLYVGTASPDLSSRASFLNAEGFFLFLIGFSMPLLFIYFLTRKTLIENLKSE
ncbi:MAG: hypothetical protein HY590_07850 [Candidatus Omnitrophica bacterium]|nr:hypothetical protein [Candidatus Omnitrophota bacterium]